MTAPKLKLPELNQRVGVVLSDGRLLSSRVEGIDPPSLLIAAPADHGVTYLLGVSEQVALEWTTARGLLRAVGRVTGRVETGVPSIRVELDESSVIQRREFVRVECSLTFDLRRGGQRFTGTTLDLSGAGVRVSVPLELQLEDAATIVLYMPGGSPIEARAAVVRVDGGGVYALHFTELDPRQKERLIQYVFAAHRREFATVRRSA